MSLEQQEEVLLRLLFDAELREAFLERPEETLARFPLTEAERADFLGLNREGLRVDARDRRALVLSRLCRSYPLSFGALSAVPGGMELMGSGLTSAHFRLPAHERTAHFGRGLASRLRAGRTEATADERPLLLVLLEWESALAACAGALRQAVASGTWVEPGPAPSRPPAGWERRGLSLAPYLAVVALPAPLAELRRALCPCAPELLWERLERAPAPRQRLKEVVASAREPRLAMGRAVVERAWRVEANVGHRLLEVPAGFSPVLGHLEGRRTAAELLAGFQKAGAPAPLLQSIGRGLWQMVEQGMVRLG